MNGTTLERPDAAAYLAAIRSELADLPPEERDDLVADVEASLLESDEPPHLSPREFAAELREAAGLSPAPEPAKQSLLDHLRSHLSTERARAWAWTARELAPIWWVARAYVAVVTSALLLGYGWPVGTGTNDGDVIVAQTSLVVVMAVAVSVWLGLRGRRSQLPWRRVRIALNALLAVALVPVASVSLDLLASRASSQTFVVEQAAEGLAYYGEPVRNIFPYSREGRLLQDVLLYDQNGSPLGIPADVADVNRRVLMTPAGDSILNAFPIRYYEPGTEWVARPKLAPPVDVPRIATPPLEERVRPPG